MKPNWSNQTIWTGDNLPILRGMNSESVDLIYLDPPFNSKANYAAPIGSKAAGAAFKDTWTLSDVDAEWINLIEAKHPALYRVLLASMTSSDKSYLAYMAARLLEMRRVLKPTGSIYLHCDSTMSHYLKLLMDAVFGQNNFRNEIVWCYQRWTGATRHFQRMHDVILLYARSKNAIFNTLFEPHSEKGLKRHKGRNRLTKISSSGRLEQQYVSEHGTKAMRDVWEISYLNANAKERVGYPTQNRSHTTRPGHQGELERWRRRAGPVRWLRYRLCERRISTAPVGRHRHQPEGCQASPPADDRRARYVLPWCTPNRRSSTNRHREAAALQQRDRTAQGCTAIRADTAPDAPRISSPATST